MKHLPLILALVLGLGGPALAQQIVQPPPGQNPDQGCLVKGLNPNGDGFLAVRAGPGTSHPKIDELRNGDAAFLGRWCENRWCYINGGVKNGQAVSLEGWIYDAWCEFYP